MIRLATAHAKLRMSKNVDNGDIEIAAKMLNSCIFQESSEMSRQAEVYSDEDDVKVSPKKSKKSIKKENESPEKRDLKKDMSGKKKTPAGKEETKQILSSQGSKGSKRMKIDHDEQVSELFHARPQKDISNDQKKIVFKLANKTKDSQKKTPIGAVWRAFQELEEKDKKDKSGKKLVESKEQLLDIVKRLEDDNLVMYDEGAGMIILI
mmetsp:Transcript_6/g.9  ORF Transcript_6/g.9 Transcript_6/m.9 type:complete len:208 (-) Transcript_6:43-666(-)